MPWIFCASCMNCVCASCWGLGPAAAFDANRLLVVDPRRLFPPNVLSPNNPPAGFCCPNSDVCCCCCGCAAPNRGFPADGAPVPKRDVCCGWVPNRPPPAVAGAVVVLPNNPPPVVVGAAVVEPKRPLVPALEVFAVLPNKPPPVVLGAVVVLPNRPPDGAVWGLVAVFPNNPPPGFVAAVLPNKPPPAVVPVPATVFVLPNKLLPVVPAHVCQRIRLNGR